MPDAHGLGRDVELAGDLSLADADGEQLGRSQPASLEPLPFLLCRRAARDGRHACDPDPPGSQLQLGSRPSTRHPSSFYVLS
jgi:hypothetical protein